MTSPLPTDAEQQSRASPTARGPFDSSRIIASLIPGIVAWLLTGGIALGYEKINFEELAWMLIVACVFAQGIAALFTLIGVEWGWPGRGMQIFAAGAAGFGLTAALTFALARSVGPGIVFWSMSGIYLGWLVEAFVRPLGRLSAYMNRIAPARQGEDAIRLQTVTPAYDLVDTESPKNSMEEGNSSQSRPLQGA